jgi:hypothetical protein
MGWSRRVLAGALLLAIVGCGDDSADRTSEERKPTTSAPVVRSCGARVEGRLPSGWRSNSVSAGPLAFAYGAQLALEERRRELVDEKMLLGTEGRA